jgi:16S rRNA C967 or C1407 C5-methylase (RsmB/RsmF family)
MWVSTELAPAGCSFCTMVDISKEKLAELLREAEKAHAEYEKSLGKRDESWPEWYAEYIVNRLSE